MVGREQRPAGRRRTALRSLRARRRVRETAIGLREGRLPHSAHDAFDVLHGDLQYRAARRAIRQWWRAVRRHLHGAEPQLDVTAAVKTPRER